MFDNQKTRFFKTPAKLVSILFSKSEKFGFLDENSYKNLAFFYKREKLDQCLIELEAALDKHIQGF